MADVLKISLNNSRRSLVGSILADYMGDSTNSRYEISNITKYEKIFLRRIPLSRFLATTLRVNKIAKGSFVKGSVIHKKY